MPNYSNLNIQSSAPESQYSMGRMAEDIQEAHIQSPTLPSASNTKSIQTTDTLLLIRPQDFRFNEQTAADNEFQVKLPYSQEELRKIALKEFDSSVELITKSGVNVIVFDKGNYESLKEDVTPDQVFPNNWFQTDDQGKIFVHRMATINRRLETNTLPFISQLLKENDYKVQEVHDLTQRIEEDLDNDELFLEGTGSMILDKTNKKIYAAISKRTSLTLVQKYGAQIGYKVVAFNTLSSHQTPFYHTNIIFAIGEGFAACCFDAIVPDQREYVRNELLENGHEIVELTLEQVEQSFCGNILQVRSSDSKRHIIMSSRASKGLDQSQLRVLQRHGEIIPLPLDVIETVGGGSARCMCAEVFLPKLN